jgi:coproporphyrinogen III oxidase-like Fe-S oxidoreductase
MYALPGQSLEEARRDLETALLLAPPHLSAYHLTLEPNTPFAAQPPDLPDDDLAADMQAQAEDTAGSGGLRNYETSAFAKPGHRCRHNLNYWTFGDYLGIGAGAHGKLSFHDRIERQARVKHPRAYLEAVRRRTPGFASPKRRNWIGTTGCSNS